MIAFWQMQVNCGGNLRGLTFSTVWLVFDDYRWHNPSANPGDGISFRPSAYLYSSLHCERRRYYNYGRSGAVITIDDVWQFGSVNCSGWNLQRNGIEKSAGSIGRGRGVGGATPVSLIEVTAYGQLFAQSANGVAGDGFVPSVAQEIQIGPPKSVLSGRVPVDMRFNPPFPNLVLASPVGTSLITVEVQATDRPLPEPILWGPMPAATVYRHERQ
jgi:hypothetical protein